MADPTPDITPPAGAQGPEAAGQNLRPVPPQESAEQAAAKAEAQKVQKIEEQKGEEEALQELAGQRQPQEAKTEDTIQIPDTDTEATNAPETPHLGKIEYTTNENTEELTPEAKDLLKSVEEQGAPAFISDNMRRIAQQNGIEINKDTTPNEVIEALKAKGAKHVTESSKAGQPPQKPPTETAQAAPGKEPKPEGEGKPEAEGQPTEQLPGVSSEKIAAAIDEQAEELKAELARIRNLSPAELAQELDEAGVDLNRVEAKIYQFRNIPNLRERHEAQRDQLLQRIENLQRREKQLKRQGKTASKEDKSTEELAEERKRLEQEEKDRQEIMDLPAGDLRKIQKREQGTLSGLRKRLEKPNISPARKQALQEQIQRLETRQEIITEMLPGAEAEEEKRWREELENKPIDDLTQEQSRLQDRETELQNLRRTPEQRQELQDIQRQLREIEDALNRKMAEEVKTAATEMAQKTEEENIKNKTSTEIFKEVRRRQSTVKGLRKDLKRLQKESDAEGLASKQIAEKKKALYKLHKRLQAEEKVLSMYQEALYKSDQAFREMSPDERAEELVKIGQEIDISEFDYELLKTKELSGKQLSKEELAALGTYMIRRFTKKGAKSMFNSEGVDLGEMRKICLRRPELQKFFADRLAGDKGFEAMVADKVPNAQKLLRWAKNNPAWLMIILAILAGVVAGPASVAIGAAKFGTSKQGLLG